MEQNRYLYLVILILLFLPICKNFGEKIPNVPAHLKMYIDVMKKDIPFKKISDQKGYPCILNKKQFLEDIDMMEYLFNYAYSGKKYWEDKGVDFKAFFEAQRKLARDFEWFSVEKLMNRMEKHFSKIVDNHMVISGVKQIRFRNHKHPMFADLLLEKTAEGFKVISSNDSKVPIGEKYTGSKENLFPTLSPEGKEHFLIGVFTYENPKTIDLNFNGKVINLSVHDCKISKFNDEKKELITQKKIEGISMISVRRFTGDHKRLDDFTKLGTRFRDTKVLIYDLLNNGGGGSAYGQKFIKNLKDVSQWRRTGGGIESAPTIQQLAQTDLEKAGYEKKSVLVAREKGKES